MNAKTKMLPNWKHWKLVAFVEGWEAAALSLGMEPRSMKNHPQAWLAGSAARIFDEGTFLNAEEKNKFDDRMRIVATFGMQSKDRRRYINSGEVALAEFAAWCAQNRLRVLRGFASLGRQADEGTPLPEATNKSALFWSVKKREELRAEHARLKKSGHKSPTEELAKKHGISTARIRELKRQPGLKPKQWNGLRDKG